MRRPGARAGLPVAVAVVVLLVLCGCGPGRGAAAPDAPGGTPASGGLAPAGNAPGTTSAGTPGGTADVPPARLGAVVSSAEKAAGDADAEARSDP